MSHLPIIDLLIIAIYLLGLILAGLHFSRKNRNPEQFTKASGKIPSWAVGISIYATFLSSNTFLGVPGKSFGTNWNAFVFSLSMPIAAWIGTRYFIPFYRSKGEISAYTHLEERFGPWARTYAVICFLLTELARIGSIFFGISLSLQALTGYPMAGIMVVTGLIIILYTFLGGMEAVIWTEVAQGIIKSLGAVVILYFIIRNMPGGLDNIISIGKSADKFSLGTMKPVFTAPSFWVIFLYGLFINMNNFGMDQNYIQRYQTTGSLREAASSLWLCVKIYLPVSFLFFFIGTSLFALYGMHPEWTESIRLAAATERMPHGSSMQDIAAYAAKLKPSDYGDKVLPHFMVHSLPTGVTGIIVAAILSAAMSTISSGMNASATVFTYDIYKRYVNTKAKESGLMRVLLTTTFVVGMLGIVSGMAMIGVKSILDIWWELSGIFASGMLGLFLLGLVSKKTKSSEAFLALIIGILVILWMTFPKLIPENLSNLRSVFHTNMTIVFGTLSLFLSGILFNRLRSLIKK